MKRGCRGRLLLKKDGKKIIRCDRCGYAHVVPMYSEKELEKFYEDIYVESTPSFTWHEKVLNIKKWKKPGRVLDIGCWEGKQLEFFRKEGWECAGTELNKRAAGTAASKGIEVHQLSIKDFFARFKGHKWDVINAAYILEHIPDPRAFLLKLKKNLKKEGVVIVEVPNEFSPLQMAYMKKRSMQPYWIALPDHLNYFDKNGIEKLVKDAGYTIIHGEATFPMEAFLLMGDDYLKDAALGKASFRKVVEMEGALRDYDPCLLSEIYSALYRCGVGRSIVLYAKAL